MTLDKTEQENGHVAASASVVEQSETLPPWLDSKPSGTANGFKSPPSTPRTAAQEDESAESFSLISEDDLPEWLRALGDQEFESEETQPAPFAGRLAGRPATASPAATAIPSVSRAWLSRPRNAETEGAAEVAEDFAPLETGPTAGYARIAKPQTAELTSPDESQTPPAAEPQIVGEGSTASDTRRVRLIMLSVVVVLVVILGYYAVSNFL